MRRTAVAAATVAAVLAAPAAASAKTYTAYAGQSIKPSGGAPESTELNQFFPTRMKVRAGDKVRYENRGFHTVSVLSEGGELPSLAIPVPGETYQGINDPQGNPFFFNGLPKFKYNEEAFGPLGDGKVDGEETDSSGAFFPSEDGPGEATLTFTQPGRYKVLCFIHPGMEQQVRVLKRKAKGADKTAKVRARALKQQRKWYKQAAKVAKQKPPANTVFAGNERRKAALLAFLPESLTVARGTTVEFRNNSSTEVHNMVFGPIGEGQYAQQFQQQTDLFPMGPGTPSQVSPGFLYGSEPAVNGIRTYSGNEFGNGFLWTPLLDGLPGDPPSDGLPSSERITFDTAGTFRYICAVHGPDMSGTIVVQ